jgi:hypothetical protein
MPEIWIRLACCLDRSPTALHLARSDIKNLTFRSTGRTIVSAVSGTATQCLQILTPKFESERVRLELYEAAEGHGLKLERMTGSRGPLGYRINVTVTGPPEQIEAFHRRFEGDGWWGGGGSDIAELILNPFLAGLFGSSQRSIASRLRRRKLERQAADQHPDN